jgi:hypothetical protein
MKIFLLILVSFILLKHSFLYSLNQITNSINIHNFISNAEINKIISGEIISRMYVKYNVYEENTHMSISIPKTNLVNEDLSTYDIFCDEKAFIPYNLNYNTKLHLFNTLVSYSKLKGMRYYSRSDDKIMCFIMDCYRINNLYDETRLDDEEFINIQPEVENYFKQRDNKFGFLYFKSELINVGNNFILINDCEKVNNNIFQITNFNGLKSITYLIYDNTLGGFFLYSYIAANINNDFLLKIGLFHSTSFSDRLRACSVHLAYLLGLNWVDKLNPWDKIKLRNGDYKNY